MDNIESNKPGAPLGNQNALKGKRWSDAIDRALAKRCKGDGIKALDDLAEKLLLMAEDMSALKELGDRIEGKPQQQVALDAKHSGTVILQLTETDADL
jgi:hypothetical protein